MNVPLLVFCYGEDGLASRGLLTAFYLEKIDLHVGLGDERDESK
jgi:hypothetical protein